MKTIDQILSERNEVTTTQTEERVMLVMLDLKQAGHPKPLACLVNPLDFEAMTLRLGARVESDKHDDLGWDQVYVTLYTAAGAVRVEPRQWVERGRVELEQASEPPRSVPPQG